MEEKLKTEKNILEVSLNMHDLAEFNLDSYRISCLQAKCFQDLYGLQGKIVHSYKDSTLISFFNLFFRSYIVTQQNSRNRYKCFQWPS